MPPRPIAVDSSLTCCRYVLADSGLSCGPAGHGCVRNHSLWHVGLILILCGLVFEYVGDFADLLVVGYGELGSLLRGATWDTEGVPVEAMFVRGGGWCSGEVGS